MKPVNADVYYTKDLSEATALVCKGAKLVRLEPQQNFYWFVFENKSSCEQLANSYWSGELQISAKLFADTNRSLKDRLFARR